ncbi:unnamed protein product, partial [Timema podura]|nr:unnamed protein product [Timema podura]
MPGGYSLAPVQTPGGYSLAPVQTPGGYRLAPVRTPASGDVSTKPPLKLLAGYGLVFDYVHSDRWLDRDCSSDISHEVPVLSRPQRRKGHPNLSKTLDKRYRPRSLSLP